ncbi:class I SAM-dependent methyltransferase [Streptomyces sp. PSRA5]
MFDYDAELRLYNEHFRAAARVGSGDRVLDIGCGTGQTTREAARAATTGSALGVDLSAPMLERARRLSDEQGPTPSRATPLRGPVLAMRSGSRSDGLFRTHGLVN